MTDTQALDLARAQLAPQGKLRVALNMSNFLLVNAKDPDGEPDGVSPAIARAIARELDVDLQLIRYEGPGLIADAAQRDEWDIANIAAEPARARVISFSPAYCEIQASYLVPAGSSIEKIEDVDQPGIRIAVKERAAYDLWLTDNLQHASLHRSGTHDTTFEMFCDEQMDALAGLRPKLIEQQALLKGSTLFNESFTAVQQSVGCKPGNEAAEIFLENFVNTTKAAGLVDKLIEHYGVSGKLSVAS